MTINNKEIDLSVSLERPDNWMEVQRKILEFCYSEETTLSLSSSKDYLADIFNMKPLAGKLTTLKLNLNRHLTVLPESFGNLQALTDLQIKANSRLTALPESFGNLQALTTLDLTGNRQLITLPKSFGNLRALTNLCLRANTNFTTLPESFGNLQALISLDLSGNRKLTTLPESFGNLRALTVLKIDQNGLTTLPESFGNLRALTTLLLNNNRLTTLPESFGNLRILTFLKLNKNNLTSLPESFGNLRALRTLLLKNNRLTTLPESFSNLGMLTFLKLNKNNLIALPHSLGKLQELRELYLSNNCLTTLPESFGNLQGLEELYLEFNQDLTTLPESFGNLQELTILDLNECQLTTLPESFGNLQALTDLDLHKCQLATLPESFANLQALTALDLSLNRHLTGLPESFGNLRVLRKLVLNNTPLTTLPESFGNLRALTTLNLSDCHLTALPESFDNLQALGELDLNSNPLSGVPIQLFNLPFSAIIDLTGCNLSQAVLEGLRQVITSPNYQGPQISFSIADRNEREEQLSIEESLAALYRVIGKEPEEFSDLEKSEALRTWLSRLSDIAEYKSGGELQKGLVHKIIAYISQANTDKEFRKIFHDIIVEASATCGDRMALSILHLGLNYQLATIDLKDIKGLAIFLKGVWAIDLLEKIARKKVATLRFFDEIEVYLGYPIKLKEDLSLPIDIQEMLYFRCSALKEKDLKEAKDSVLSTQKDQDAYYKFLISHDKWKNALLANYEKEYQAIMKKKDTDMDAATDHPDYTAIKETFERELIKLTEKALKL